MSLMNIILKMFFPVDPVKAMGFIGILIALTILILIGNVFIKGRFISYYTDEKYGKSLGAARISAAFMIVGFFLIALILGIIMAAVIPAAMM